MSKAKDGLRLLAALAAVAILTAGVWGGLVKLGWRIPIPQINWSSYHAILMLSGFLGTLVAIERAGRCGPLWSYAAPLLSLAGTGFLAAGSLDRTGPALIAAASGALVLVALVVACRERDTLAIIPALGAAAWLVANLLWARGREIPDIVHWWQGFLVLGILGVVLQERLLAAPAPHRRVVLALASLASLALILSLFAPGPGRRAWGVALTLIALSLILDKDFNRNVRRAQFDRFRRLAEIAGALWLVFSGMLWASGLTSSRYYDPVLHSVFLGFAVTTVLGHAPRAVPALSRLSTRFHWVYYVPLALLQGSVLLRMASDLAAWGRGRQWAGVFHATALTLYLAVFVLSIRRTPAESAVAVTPRT